MNGINKIYFTLVFFIFSCQFFGQTDTSKIIGLEIAIYKKACKLIDSLEYKKAITLLKSVIKIDPFHYNAYNKMGLAKIKTNDFKGAEKSIKQAIRILPDNVESYKMLVDLFFEEKRFSESKLYLDSAMTLEINDPELYYFQAKLMYVGKSYKPALDACLKAIDLNPYYMDAFFLRGEIRFAMKEYNYAIKEITDGISFERADFIHYQSYKTRALARFLVHDYQNAINDWNVYLEAFPEDEAGLISRGANKIEVGDHTGAIIDFDEAINLNANNPVSYNYRGVAKGENKQFVEAIKDFNTSIKLKFDYGAAYVNRAAVKFASKDKRGACEDLNKADSLGDELAVSLIETYCTH